VRNYIFFHLLPAFALVWLVFSSGCAILAPPTDDTWEADKLNFRYLAQTAQYAQDAYLCRPEVTEKYEAQFEVRYFYEKFFGEEVGCRFDGLVTFHRAFVLIPTCGNAANCRKERIIAIKGSETLGDWLINLAASQFRDPKYRAKYHQGFRLAAYNLLADINDWKPLQPDERITITGHSKGGAVALSVFYQLLDMGFPPERLRVITFGQPKLSTTSDDPHPERIIRLVNQDDPVPRMPPDIKDLGLEYRHNTQALYLLGEGKWSHQPPRQTFFGITLSIRGIDVSDHTMSLYTEHLKEIAETCNDPNAPPGYRYNNCRVGTGPTPQE